MSRHQIVAAKLLGAHRCLKVRPSPVGDHSRDKGLSPKGHDRQQNPYEQNRYRSGPTLVEMSLRENEQLQLIASS
jgi:hypothetical protein